MDAASWMSLATEAIPQVEALRAFKLEILKRLLCKKVEFSLSPTFMNHMVNELDEYRSMPMFPTLGQFDNDVACEMFKFKDYLEELKVNVLEAKTVGSLPALVPDHMAREECYFLYRLHESDPQNVPSPACDPARPRISQ